MGVSLCVWRARIGCYDSKNISKNSSPQICQYKENGSALVYFLLLFLLVTLAIFECLFEVSSSSSSEAQVWFSLNLEEGSGPDFCTMKWYYQLLLILLVVGNIELNPGPATFTCKRCTEVFPGIMENALHQKMHSAERNFMYSCPGPACWQQWNSYQGLISHINSHHPLSKPSSGVSSMHVSYNCVIPGCSEGNLSGSRSLCSHLVEHLTKGDSFNCPFKNTCSSNVTFSNVQNSRTHLSVKHVGWRNDLIECGTVLSVRQSAPSELDKGDDIDNDNNEEFYDAQEYETSSVPEKAPSFTSSMFAKHMATFYLMLLSECFLADDTVQLISEHMATLSELVQYWYREQIVMALKKLEVDESKSTSILNSVLTKDVFYNTHHKNCPGPSLTSIHLRKEYYKSNFSAQEPQEIPLDDDREDGEFVHYFNVEKTLNVLFKDPSVQAEIEESFLREGGKGEVFRDYYDGKVCQDANDPPERIDLILFQDVFKSSKNALGSAANKLKFVGTYFLMGNLRPETRTKVSSINLALLIKERLIKKYGVKKCFAPLLDELKKLTRTGIVFNNRVVPVRLQFICGDNLGSHAIGGFVESFSGSYFCRFCEVTSVEFKENPLCTKVFRTVEDYDKALVDFRYLKRLKKRMVTYKGLKQNSPFNELPNFHVADPRLPVCLAHDLFENGVMTCDFKLMINYFVSKKWFRYEDLESLISKFKYSPQDIRNKPAAVPKPTDQKNRLKLGGHAVQNWCLLRVFPFIIEGRIRDTDDAVWQLYLKLKYLVEFICKPSFTTHELDTLDSLIVGYMQERNVLPGHFVKPKYHYLMHYVELIRLFGPLIFVWTLRFEAKHQFFKRVMRICNNTINPGWTMAQRYRWWFSYLTSGLVYPSGVAGTPKTHPLDVNGHGNRVKEMLDSHSFSSTAVETSKVTYNDVVYIVGSYLFLKRYLEDISVAVIRCIILDKGEAHLIVEKFAACSWQGFGIYKINDGRSLGFEIVKTADLKNFNFNLI